MFIAAVMLSIFLAGEAICFSDYSTLEGDSQQLVLTAVLQPKDARGEDNVFCESSDGKEAEIIVKLASAVHGTSEFEQQFTYRYGVTNRVQIDLSIFDFDIVEFMNLISLPTANYIVHMPKLEEQIGTFSQIMHTKQDVSGCWSLINFRFGIMPGDEYFGFTLEPNMCQIPEDVMDSIQLVAKTTVRGVPLDLQFMESSVSGGFSYPYDHEYVTSPVQHCADYERDEEREQCLYFLKVVETDTDWQIKVGLLYSYMGIQTEIIGDISGIYELFDSEICSLASSLQVDLRENRVMVSHDSFETISVCNKEQPVTKTITWVMQIIGDYSLRLYGEYEAEEYYKTRDFLYSLDNADLFSPSVLVYYESIYKDENGTIVGGFTIFKNMVLNCITQLSLRIGGNHIKIEQRMSIANVCTSKGVESKLWRLELLDRDFTILQSISGIEQDIDFSKYINKFTVFCAQTEDPAQCSSTLKKVRAIALKKNALFEFTADTRQFGNLIYSDNNSGVYALIAGIFAVYLLIGLAVVLSHILKQNKKE